jgi:2',3'-cyclic-nucleotide 2'-phosphodiesterase (5'-nucleotidase family)
MLIRRLSVLLGLMVLAAGARAETTRVTFLLVNDIYEMAEQVQPDGKARGGFARLAAIVKAERARGGHVIFAHAGDTLSPSPMSAFDRGAHIIALTNLLAPDIFVPGNHEFDFGQAIFLERMAAATFPLFAANLRAADGAPLPGFRDRAVVTFDGVRIGLTAATYDDAARTSSPGDLRFLPTVATAREQAEALRAEGADFAVAVVHASRRQDYALMATRAVDLVLSGHDHDLFVNFDGRTAAVESSHDAHYVTAIDIDIAVSTENGRRTTTWWPQFRIIDSAAVTPDAEVAAAVARFDAEFAGASDVPLATTAVALDGRTATLRTQESALGNLVADAMRAFVGADAAIMNGGGIRGDRLLPAGSPIARRDLLAALPFANRVVPLAISGADLRAAIENGLAKLPAADGRFPQVSGLTIEAAPARPAGARVVSIKVGDMPLDDAKTYRLATIDYLARGGDGYLTLRDARRLLPEADTPLLTDAVATFLRRLGTVRGEAEARVIFK